MFSSTINCNITTSVNSIITLFFFLVFNKFISISSCYIQGHDSGRCVDKERLDLKFCRDIVQYTACVPTLPSSLEKIYPTHDMFTKDAWVENLVNRVVQERKRHEMNQTLKELGENEYGPKYNDDGSLTERGGDKVERRFWNGNYQDPDGIMFADKRGGQDITDCEKAYKHYMCYLNFPRCDDEGKSLVLCRSVCENYANACHIHESLSRCGPNEFLGSYDGAEVPILNEESKEFSLFIRGVWPGWPFRDYMERGLVTQSDGTVVLEEEPVIRCTPSIKGVGGTIELHMASIIICVVMHLALFFWY